MPATRLLEYCRPWALALLTCCGATGARAQLVADGDLVTLNGVSTNLGEVDLIVGNIGANTRLVITNAGSVENTSGYVGFESGAGTNRVIVTGAGSIWTNTAACTIGNAGSFNSLLITNGGRVENSEAAVGDAAGANYNQTMVTGPDSVWNNAAFIVVGLSGSFNTLLATNGGVVFSSGGYLGNNSEATGNQVTVSGSNSAWTNTSTLSVGENGASNTLTIASGGTVVSFDAYVGNIAGASNNLAIVSGPNSVWDNGGTLSAGNEGAFNSLLITNGGKVNSYFAFVGSYPGAYNNRAIVDGDGSEWNSSGSFFVGDEGSFNTLLISGGGRVANVNGYIGNSASGTNNRIVVNGANSVWVSSGDLSIGDSGSFNTLIVTNGGHVTNATARVGRTAAAANNRAIVSGPGSVWYNSDELGVGDAGSFNHLIVTNGGTVFDTNSYIGRNFVASSNQATVIGAGSRWTNSSTLSVGEVGSFNTLFIANGGRVASALSVVGYGLSSSNNQAVVSGNNSAWDCGGNLHIGESGSLNTLLVTNGGSVSTSDDALIGVNVSAFNNLAIVSGTNSQWNIGGHLIVGNVASFNGLVVSNAGAVNARTGITVGYLPGNGHSITVAGGALRATNAASDAVLDIRRGTNVLNAGLIETDRLRLTNTQGRFEFNGGTLLTRGTVVSNGLSFVVGNNGVTPAVWDVRGDTVLSSNLVVGLASPNCRLYVTNGAAVFDTVGMVGSNSSGNAVFITGEASAWSNRGALNVGISGSYNQLAIGGGGRVFNVLSAIGVNSAARSNAVVVTGAGSVWSNAGVLSLGSNGGYNQLVISNSGAVFNPVAILGVNPAGEQNTALITGAGSVWNNGASLMVGSNSCFNQMIVSAGGTVLNPLATIGVSSAARTNTVLVTGAGSVWSNSGPLTVGSGGSFNQLIITNRGVVLSTNAVIGANATASNNLVLVTGAGSLWSNPSFLTVGNTGSLAQLVIRDVATVLATACTIGANASSTNNRLVVEGGALWITNASATATLDIRRGTNQLSGGSMGTDLLRLTNVLGFFEFNGGTLRAGAATVTNGALFTVGNGASAATYNLGGAVPGMHAFANGLRIAGNATLTGNGTISGTVTVAVGGTFAPGSSVGKIVLSNAPALQGGLAMEVSKSGATLTNDQIQVAGTLAYGGSLTVTKLGPTALSAGDSFPLFSASSYSGALSSIVLPPPPAGLSWTNRLLVNGSIAVVPKTIPNISAFARTGTNFRFSVTGGSPGAPWYLLTTTNVAAPLSNWTTNLAGVFDWVGNVNVTNGINFTEPRRFFRFYAP